MPKAFSILKKSPFKTGNRVLIRQIFRFGPLLFQQFPGIALGEQIQPPASQVPKDFAAKPKGIGLAGVAEPAIQLHFEGIRRYFSAQIRIEPFVQPFFETLDVFPFEPAVRIKYSLPEKVDPYSGRENGCLFFVQLEPKLGGQKMPNGLFCFVQHPFFVVKQNYVVNVTDIGFYAKFLFYKMVEGRQVKVSEKLAGKVAHRQPLTPLLEGEQVIAGKVVRYGLLWVGVVNNQVDEPQGGLAFDLSGDDAF